MHRCLFHSAARDTYDARFRGRQMTGTLIQLPASAKGFLFEETEVDAMPVPAAAAEADGEGEEGTSKPEAVTQTQWKVSAMRSRDEGHWNAFR
jgi:hypothetical protein